jgi:hypothetical protein
MSVIVVEGCDGSGKTTLIEQARGNQKDRYFVTLRASRYQPTLKTAFQYLSWIRHQTDLDLVLDRFHFISDRVYGPILRNEDVFADIPISFGLEKVAAIVYCRPPTPIIIENSKKGVQLEGVAERVSKLVDKYDFLMDALALKGHRVFTYDYTGDDPHEFWKHVWQHAKENKSA